MHPLNLFSFTSSSSYCLPSCFQSCTTFRKITMQNQPTVNINFHAIQEMHNTISQSETMSAVHKSTMHDFLDDMHDMYLRGNIYCYISLKITSINSFYFIKATRVAPSVAPTCRRPFGTQWIAVAKPRPTLAALIVLRHPSILSRRSFL